MHLDITRLVAIVHVCTCTQTSRTNIHTFLAHTRIWMSKCVKGKASP